MTVIGDRKPWHHVGHRVLGNPFSSLGIDWCPRCESEVDTDTVASHRGTVYVFKRTCRRCGTVIKCGVWQNVPLLADRPLPPAALEWITTPGQDRR